MTDRCGNCQFFENLGNDGPNGDGMFGFCRRYPPVVPARFKKSDEEICAVWPKTNRREWCGEFQAFEG